MAGLFSKVKVQEQEEEQKQEHKGDDRAALGHTSCGTQEMVLH